MLTRMTAGRSKYGEGRWPSRLPPPIDPMADTYRYRAQSILQGLATDRDGRSYHATAFTPEQAEEIVRWAQKTPVQ
jgi:hypothetical protein